MAQPFKYTYRLNGQYSVVTLPNGQTRTYSYDNQGRLLQLANALGGTNLATYAYGYDVDNSTGLSTMLGQRTSLTASVPTQGFTNALTKYYYDPLYQLTKAAYPGAFPFNSEVDSWSYDAIGNRLTNTVNGIPATYTYLKNGSNPLNGQRLSNDGTNAYTWDSNGSNLTRNGTPGSFTFGYSVDNRLNSISGAATATYTYDYQGRRTSKTVGITTTYLYDGLNLVTETMGGNAVNYVFGPGIDEPLATYQNGTLGYFSSDPLGTVSLVSNATGTVQNSYVFDAWGNTRTSSATLTDSFGYTGREFGEAGLLNYRARYLQTGVGRFTQEDPARLRAGINFYAYVKSSPTRNTDPSGLYTLDSSCQCIVGPVSPETCNNEVLGNCFFPVLGTMIQKAFHNQTCRKAFADNGVDWGAFVAQLMPTWPYPTIVCDQSYCAKGAFGAHYPVQRVVPLCKKQFNLDYETAASTAFHEFLHGVGAGTSQQDNIMQACFPGHME